MRPSSDDSQASLTLYVPLGPQPAHPVSRPFEEAVSGASRRLRALAELSGSLTDALGPDEAADLVEKQALSALGATSAVVVTLGTFPAGMLLPTVPAPTPLLHVVHAIGLPDAVKATMQRLPLDAPVPLAEVARTGIPMFLSSQAELRHYDGWGSAAIASGACAAAIVPVWANGELRGVLGLTWAEPRVFDEDERAFVLTLGVMCAQAIMRAHLRAAERHAREAAEEANRSKTRFVATISHELRTPMNAVLGYTALIAEEIDGPVSALQKAHLDRVRSSGKHLLELIDELLIYARVEAGEETVHAEDVLLIDVVEQSLVMVQPMADSKGLRIRIDGPLESVALFTDIRKLRQILVNLLANAIKFSDAGDVTLLFRVDGHEGELRVRFDVIDTGRGIAFKDQARIFEPFWQAKASASDTASSTGLGLSVARQLARLLGGDVVVTSGGLGMGSTFVVSLPIRYRAPQ